MKIQEVRTAVINMSRDEYDKIKEGLDIIDTFITYCEDVLDITFHFEDAIELIDDSTVVNIINEDPD